MRKKSILVTGLPRAGTTWVGRTIAKAPSVRYVHEPFNINRLPCYCGVNFDYWFYYLSSTNEDRFLEHVTHTIYPKFDRVSLVNLLSTMKRTKRIRPLKQYAHSFFEHTVLVKDPLAVFSTQWLAKTFDMDVVVIIRHPAAVVHSYSKLNWSHPFDHFLKQPALMEEHLADFTDEITDFSQNEYDIIDQAALLWKLTYYMILQYREKEADWIFVRHNDLALEPVKGFQTIFEKLDLIFSDQVKRSIDIYSNANSTEAADPYSIRRQSEQTIWSWKDSLTQEEICRVRKRVEGVSQAFFRDEDW